MSAEMKVYFVRHAQSVNNVLPGDLGSDEFEARRHPDAPLTDRGVAQTVVAAKQVVEMVPEATLILTSYLSRALRTAAVIADEYHAKREADETSEPSTPQVVVRVCRDIHEVGGSYYRNVETKSDIGTPGTTSKDVLAAFPAFTFRDGEDCSAGWWRSDKREKRVDAEERAMDLYYILCNEFAKGIHKSVVVVTHGDFFRVLNTTWRKRRVMTPSKGEDSLPPIVNLSNTGITLFTFRASVPQLLTTSSDASNANDEANLSASPPHSDSQNNSMSRALSATVTDPDIPCKVELGFQNDVAHLSEVGVCDIKHMGRNA